MCKFDNYYNIIPSQRLQRGNTQNIFAYCLCVVLLL